MSPLAPTPRPHPRASDRSVSEHIEREHHTTFTLPATSPPRLRFRAPLAILLALLTHCCGCGATVTDIDEAYGHREGESVNGTGVLAGMFEDAGHTVRTWHALSPALDRHDVIVWFPQDFDVPSAEQRDRLEEWLAAKPGRTLVYVGRDYDASVTYWKTVAGSAPADQAPLVQQRLQHAESRHDFGRRGLPADQDCGWFVLHRDAAERQVTSLQGAWSVGVDASKVEIPLRARLDPPGAPGHPFTHFRREALLYSRDEVLVGRVADPAWQQSNILVVTNGAFLLNLPLVNHEHRKLAGRLVDECGTSKRVVFLEGADLAESDSQRSGVTGLELFLVWPINAILLHLAALAIVMCFYAFPIFGRPRELPPASRSDFGKHVDALGRLLTRTGAEAYAKNRLAEYQQIVKREALSSRVPRGRAAPATQSKS